MSSPFIWYEKPCELRWSLPCRFNTSTMSISCVDESYVATATKIQPRQNKWMKISASRDQQYSALKGLNMQNKTKKIKRARSSRQFASYIYASPKSMEDKVRLWVGLR